VRREDAELPAGWAFATIADLVQPRTGKANPQLQPDSPFIGMEHIEPHTMRLLGTAPCRTMKSAASAFRSTDVLYGRLRAYLNKVYQPEFDGLCSGELIVLPESFAVLGRFLKHRLNAADFVAFASHLNTGDRLESTSIRSRSFRYCFRRVRSSSASPTPSTNCSPTSTPPSRRCSGCAPS
jgi:type I restriction enzyme S subunit